MQVMLLCLLLVAPLLSLHFLVALHDNKHDDRRKDVTRLPSNSRGQWKSNNITARGADPPNIPSRQRRPLLRNTTMQAVVKAIPLSSSSDTAPSNTTKASLLSWNERIHQLLHDYQSTSNNNNATYHLTPLWTCRGGTKPNDNSVQTTFASNPRKKLIFVHVFKTAGSTFRQFVRYYSKICNPVTDDESNSKDSSSLGYAVLVSCSGLSSKTKHITNVTATWRNGNYGSRKGRSCKVKNGRLVNNQQSTPKEIASLVPMHKAVLDGVDILIGHFPVGIHSYWTLPETDAFTDENVTQSKQLHATTAKHASNASHDNNLVDAQYVVFVREPMHKYVSGFLYHNRFNQSMSLDHAVQAIKDSVLHEREHDRYHEGYSAYLLTPEQSQRIYIDTSQTEPSIGSNKEGKRWSVQERVDLILENLLQHNFMVGVVEKMSESVDLLQYLIDPSKAHTNSFRLLSGSDKEATSTTTTDSKESAQKQSKVILNPSSISTSAVVELLRQDPIVHDALTEYLKYDDLIYRFALEIHNFQYRTLLSLGWKR